MRAPHTRARLPLAALLVVVFLHTALGVLVTCHVVDTAPRTDGIERVAATEPVPGSATCPGCVSDDEEQGPVSPPDTAGSSDPCTSEHPCQHGATHRFDGSDSATRASAAGAQASPAVVALSVVARPPGRPRASVCPSGPVLPPAVREPVAVLCVDRN